MFQQLKENMPGGGADGGGGLLLIGPVCDHCGHACMLIASTFCNPVRRDSTESQATNSQKPILAKESLQGRQTVSQTTASHMVFATFTGARGADAAGGATAPIAPAPSPPELLGGAAGTAGTYLRLERSRWCTYSKQIHKPFGA